MYASSRKKAKKAAASKDKPGKARKPGVGRAAGTVVHKGKGHRTAYEQPQTDNRVSETAVAYTAKIRAIGNSKGVILNNQLMDTAGLVTDQDIIIQAVNGLITIKQAEMPAINTDLSTWDKQFKSAIKGGAKPEGDLFNGIENEFDTKEW